MYKTYIFVLIYLDFFYSKNKAACVDVNQQTPPIREDPPHVKESSENEEENVVMDIDSDGRIL